MKVTRSVYVGLKKNVREGVDSFQSVTSMKCFQAIFKPGLLFQRTQTKDLICYSAVANAKPWERERKKEISKFSFRERTTAESVNRGIRQTLLNRLFILELL